METANVITIDGPGLSDILDSGEQERKYNLALALKGLPDSAKIRVTFEGSNSVA